MGHIARNCSIKAKQFKKGNKKFHVHAVENDDSDKEKNNEYGDSTEESVLISTLTGSVSHGSDTWIVDHNGASRHMTDYKDSFQSPVHKVSPYKVKLGDDYQYPIKGMGEAFYKLDLGKPMKMKEVLYVPSLKKKSFLSQP